ncbi:MAG: hypothetical protein QG638_2259, partial [Pseudomonadota bacterium]|nr:hypothetical protein [Pseudomonadota bacterium]
MATNTTLTADIIAREALMHLDNNLVFAKQVYRGYENEFSKKVNGYEVGETISIRRPTDFTVRTNATMATQDVTEGKVALTVNQRRGVDFEFTSQDLTLRIGELGERVIKPAMIQLANSVDTFLSGMYASVPNWVGTSTKKIGSYADFAKAPERLDELAVPQDTRSAILSPSDHWALLGSQTSLHIQDAAKGAYRKGSLGEIGGVDTLMSQNVLTHTAGTRTNALIDQSLTTATVSYATVKDTMTQTIHMDGLGTTKTVKKGDVFTIADVYAVNPVTKAPLPFLKQFVVVSDVSSDAVTTGDADEVVYPALIWTGAFQNVAVTSGVTDLNDKVVTWFSAAGAQDRQNLVFHKNA